MFSERENKIIKLVSKKPVSVKYIVEHLFEPDEKPFYAEISVTNAINTIIKKCNHYQLDWNLVKIKDKNRALLIMKEY